MERIKTISILCVLLACVAPVMAADYAIKNGANLNPATLGNWESVAYNATPAQVDVDAFLAEYGADGTTNFSPAMVPAPYYQMSAAAVLPGVNDSVRLMHATPQGGTNANLLFSNVTTWKEVYFGDSYWPTAYNTYGTLHNVSYMRTGGGALNVDTMWLGRKASELPTASQAFLYDAVEDTTTNPWTSYASSAIFNVRTGSNNWGVIKVTNTNQDLGINSTLGSWGLTRTQIDTRQAAVNTNLPVINIGNIELNRTLLYFQHQSGLVNITGDIKTIAGADQGNMVFLLADVNNDGAAANDPTLRIKWSELMQLVDAGQFWVNNGTVNGYIEANGIRVNTTTGVVTGVSGTKINTQALMETNLDISWVGGSYEASGGYVNVVRSVNTDIVIPEPATLVLLGLGSVVAAFRRKR